MQQPAISFYEFKNLFPDEDACRKHLFNLKWPHGFECPQCGHSEYYEIKKRHLYQCRNCRHQTSVTANTIFHRTRIPLNIWFWVIFLVASDKRGISALAISREFPVSYPTAWAMLHKIRKAMQDRDARYRLAGIVEVDDAYFGGPSQGKKRGRGTDKSKVLVSVSVTKKSKAQFAKMEVVDDLSQDTIDRRIKDSTKAGSRLRTDGYKSYLGFGDDYEHERIIALNLDISGVLKSVHRLVSNVKAFIAGTYHGLGKKHLESYLGEYCYRYNRRFWQDQLFNRLLTACINTQPVTYADLTL